MASEAAALKSAWQQTADIATRYKAVENATRPFAALMVQLASRLTTLKTTPISIFDLGCGTGAVEAEIYDAVKKEDWKDLNVHAGDVSPPMLAYLAQRGEECGWDNLTTQIVDGSKLSESDVGGEFARVFVGFAIFVLPPDTIKLLGQKVAQGGTLAVSTWARLPWFEVLRMTLERLEDGPAMPDEAQIWKGLTNGQPWHDAGFVKEQLESAGLKKVEVVQRKENVDCGTPELFMTTMGFVLELLSAQWPEEKRAGWLKDVGDTMKAILIEKVDRPDNHLFMEFEGIVGVGLKG